MFIPFCPLKRNGNFYYAPKCNFESFWRLLALKAWEARDIGD